MEARRIKEDKQRMQAEKHERSSTTKKSSTAEQVELELLVKVTKDIKAQVEEAELNVEGRA